MVVMDMVVMVCDTKAKVLVLLAAYKVNARLVETARPPRHKMQ